MLFTVRQHWFSCWHTVGAASVIPVRRPSQYKVSHVGNSCSSSTVFSASWCTDGHSLSFRQYRACEPASLCTPPLSFIVCPEARVQGEQERASLHYQWNLVRVTVWTAQLCCLQAVSLLAPDLPFPFCCISSMPILLWHSTVEHHHVCFQSKGGNE